VPPADVAFSPSRLSGARGVDAEVLQLVAGFSPARVELFPALCPFLPDYLPSAGDIDAFLKPPRPDGREDELGLKRLDEPAALQSDPTVLDLQLRALSKKSGLDPVAVRALEHADKNPKEVLKWVASIAELRRAAPPPSVRYTRPMPEVDALMQVWPEEFEAMLRQVGGARLAGAPPPPSCSLTHTRTLHARAHTPPAGAAAARGPRGERGRVRARSVRAAGHPCAQRRRGRGGGQRAGAPHPSAAPAVHAVRRVPGQRAFWRRQLSKTKCVKKPPPGFPLPFTLFFFFSHCSWWRRSVSGT